MNSNRENILNPSQLSAVTYCDGPSVIVAGAGSGKTRVLTHKIAYLIENGLSASSILALTFTNKAAREMKDRIINIVGNDYARYLWAGTFHSIFLRILWQEVEAIGFLPNFSIYDTQDSKSKVKGIIKEMSLDEKIYTPNRIFNRISMLKNRLILPQQYHNSSWQQEDFHSGIVRFSEIFDTYCTRCKESNAMDFDDILLYTYYLFKNNADILNKYQKKFNFILVDEYQDTNIAQHQIINMLASKHNRIAVVGDDAQSIYSFRGANIDNILHFQTSFKNCKIFKLEENYRSTQNIVNAANSLIEKNQFQIPKKVYSNLIEGEKVKIISCFTDVNEADVVSDNIQMQIKKGVPCSEIAVLYRTNAQSRVFEDALRNKSIPYKIYGGISFYSRKEIKDALAYIRLVVNHSDEESLKRIINYPARGIGEKTIGKLLEFSHYNNKKPLDIILNIDSYNIDFNAGTKSRLKKFGEMISSLNDFFITNNAYSTADKIISESGIIEDLSSNNDLESAAKIDNIRELLSAVHEYCKHKQLLGDSEPSLGNFLSEISLLTDQDTDEENNKESVTLMTIHAAKGLEFKNIFVVGIEEELIPSSMCRNEMEVEEERRLLYVAITRAKELCSLSFSKTRFRWGNVVYCSPSRFIKDIDIRYIDIPLDFNQNKNEDNLLDKSNKKDFSSFFKNKKYQRTTKSGVLSANQTPDRSSILSNNKGDNRGKYNFEKGDSVSHYAFGEGKIIDIINDGDNSKAKVFFAECGYRTLLLKYSKLTKI